MSAARLRAAFVVQRCGDDVVGGAERLCRDTARALARDWDVEILTTCARDARTWADAYPPGRTAIGGVPALRFAVPVPRDPARFHRASHAVRAPHATRATEERWMHEQGPVAPDLVAHLARSGDAYDRVVFYSYLYATTFAGIPAVADRSVLVPLAHREWMLDLALFDDVFSRTAAFAYLSDEERGLVERRYPPARAVDHAIVGVGIEPPAVRPERFRARHRLAGALFVCVGRVEEAKGSADLIDAFCALQRIAPAERTLVLVGPLGMPVPKRADVVVLGQVDDAEKWDALAAATVACVPSPYESLSLAALEAWAVGTPVLANGASAVLVGQCRRANAGLWYASDAEFVELARTELFGRARELGANGRRFVRETYTWDRVRAAFGALVAGPRP